MPFFQFMKLVSIGNFSINEPHRGCPPVVQGWVKGEDGKAVLAFAIVFIGLQLRLRRVNHPL